MKKNIIIALVLAISIMQFAHAQNVGIGTTTPAYKLDVNGVVHASNNIITDNYLYCSYLEAFNNCYVDGAISIGGASIIEILNVIGNARFTGTDPTIQLQQSSVNKGFLQLSGDNIRIGTNNGNSTGNFVIRNNGADRVVVNATGDIAADGNVSVNNSKGIIQNTNGTQLRYRVGGAGLAGTNLVAGATLSVGFGFSTFSSPPTVYVGNVSNGTGSYLKVLVTVSDVTATDCTLSVTNVSSSTITFTGTWNIVAIGAL